MSKGFLYAGITLTASTEQFKNSILSNLAFSVESCEMYTCSRRRRSSSSHGMRSPAWSTLIRRNRRADADRPDPTRLQVDLRRGYPRSQAASIDHLSFFVEGAVMAPDISKRDTDRHLNPGPSAWDFRDEVLRRVFHGSSLSDPKDLLIPFLSTNLNEACQFPAAR
jgi:hypothetical protein